MSDPKRYLAKCPWYAIETQEHPMGEFVLYSDYASLKTNVERLEKEVWRMKVFKGIDEDTKATLKDALNTVPEWAKVLETIENNARLETEKIALKAEVERLTNELEKQDLLLAMANAFVTDWKAAKNGNFNETKSPGFIEDLGNGVEKHDLKFRVPPVVKKGGQP